MERCYLFANLDIYNAVEHIVTQEKPEVGKYHFDLACAPDKNKNQLFNVELIIDEDGTWAYGATVYDEEEYSLIYVTTINNDEGPFVDYRIVSKKNFKIMKENKNENLLIEDVLANW